MPQQTNQAPQAQQSAQQQQTQQQVQKVQEEAKAPAVVESAASAFNPLNGVHLTAELQQYAGALAAPYESFVSCFNDIKEGRVKWHSEIEYAIMQLTAPTKAADYLRSCFKKNPLALINAVKQVPMTGLSLNPTLKQSYLVPFAGVVTFMPSYIGLRDILVKTGLVKDLEAHLVYTDDKFEIEFGENNRIMHKPNPFSKNRTKNDILGAYWIAVMPDGTQKFDTMSISEIVDIQRRSPSGSNGPWVTDFGEMAKKSVIRRAFKSLPHVGVNEDIIKVLNVTMEADNKFFYSDNKKSSRVSAIEDFEEEVVNIPPFQAEQVTPEN